MEEKEEESENDEQDGNENDKHQTAKTEEFINDLFDGQNITAGDYVNETDAAYISEMVNEQEKKDNNDKNDKDRKVNNDNINNSFENNLKNNAAGNNVLENDIMQEMEQDLKEDNNDNNNNNNNIKGNYDSLSKDKSVNQISKISNEPNTIGFIGDSISKSKTHSKSENSLNISKQHNYATSGSKSKSEETSDKDIV